MEMTMINSKLRSLAIAATMYSPHAVLANPHYAGITATENVGVEALIGTKRGGPITQNVWDVKSAGTYHTTQAGTFAFGVDTPNWESFSALFSGSVQPETQVLKATSFMRAQFNAVTPRVGVHHDDQTWALAGIKLEPTSFAGFSINSDLLTNGNKIDIDGIASYIDSGVYVSAGGNLGHRLLVGSQAYVPGRGPSFFNQIWHNNSTNSYGGSLAIAGNSRMTSTDTTHYDTTLADVERRGVLRGWDPVLPNFVVGPSFSAHWKIQDELQADALVHYTHLPDHFFGAGVAYNGLPGCPGLGIMLDEATPINRFGLQQRVTLAVNEDLKIGVILEIGQRF
jgi:hypothetical protein